MNYSSIIKWMAYAATGVALGVVACFIDAVLFLATNDLTVVQARIGAGIAAVLFLLFLVSTLVAYLCWMEHLYDNAIGEKEHD